MTDTSALALLQDLEEATQANQPLFETLCELGLYCSAHGEEHPWGLDGDKKGLWAERCEDLLLNTRFMLVRDAITTASARVEDLRRILKKNMTNDGTLHERRRLDGLMWCLEALYGPRDEWMHDMAREFHFALVDLDLLLLERADLGLGKEPD